MLLTNKIVLGTVQFGLDYGINNPSGKVAKDEVMKILTLCESLGINKLDTSYAYGESETVLGRLLDKNNAFNIVSKLPRTTEKPISIFNETLQRLQTNKLYGYLVHHFDYFKENPSIWTDMEALKKNGQVEKIGFSLYRTYELEYLLSKNVLFDIVQIPYNILDRTFEPYFKELKQRNIEIHTRSVFLQGLFFKSIGQLPEKLTPLAPYLNTMSEFCKEQNITMEELALNGVIHNPNIDGVLVGVDNVSQLKRNIHSIWKNEPEEIRPFVDSIIIKEKELLNPATWK